MSEKGFPTAVVRADGKQNFNGHAFPPLASEILQMRRDDPEWVTPDLVNRTLRQRLVGNIWIVCSFCCLGGVLFGFDIASMSVVLALESYNNYFGKPSASLQGGISSSISAGSLLGSLIYMFSGDRFGRRGTMMIGCCIWFIGCIIQTASTGVPMLIVGRFIAGVCVGLVSSAVPVYQSELAPPDKRGRLVSLQQWGIDWGILIGYFIQYGCSFIKNGNSQLNFRLSWGIQMVPGVLLLSGMWFIFPESPRWLAAHGRYAEALDTIANVHAGGDISDPYVLAQWSEIRAQLIQENLEELSFFSIFQRRFWRRLFLACSVQMWCQLSGINALMYYIVYIFQSAGLTGKNTNLIASAIQYICFVCGTVPAIFYMDKWGRRNAWIWGGILQGTSLFIIGALQGAFGSVSSVSTNSTTVWIVENNLPVTIVIIFFSYSFIIFNAMLAGPISWCYPTEIFPLAIRSHGIGLSTGTTWAFTFAVTYFTPPALNIITYRTYFIFGTFCFASSIHFFFMFPETRGRPLEEMNVLFESGIPAWKTKNLPIALQAEIEALANAQRRDVQQQVSEVETKKEKPLHFENAGSI